MGAGASIDQLSREHQVKLARHLHEEYVRSATPLRAGQERCLSLASAAPLVGRLDGAVGELVDLSLRKRGDEDVGVRLLNEEVLDAARAGDLERIIALLSKQGSADSRNDYTGSALMEAAARGYEACMQTLIDRGAQLDLEDAGGKTALDYAITHQQHGACRVLLAAGASAVQAVHRAAWSDDAATVNFLLDLDPNLVDCQNKFGRTALAAACLAESMGVSQLLLQRGADVDRKAMRLRSALMDCCTEGKLVAADMLMAHGAKISFVDMDGRTGRQLAEDRGHHAVVASLDRIHKRRTAAIRLQGDRTRQRLRAQHVAQGEDLLCALRLAVARHCVATAARTGEHGDIAAARRRAEGTIAAAAAARIDVDSRLHAVRDGFERRLTDQAKAAHKIERSMEKHILQARVLKDELRHMPKPPCDPTLGADSSGQPKGGKKNKATEMGAQGAVPLTPLSEKDQAALAERKAWQADRRRIRKNMLSLAKRYRVKLDMPARLQGLLAEPPSPLPRAENCKEGRVADVGEDVEDGEGGAAGGSHDGAGDGLDLSPDDGMEPASLALLAALKERLTETKARHTVDLEVTRRERQHQISVVELTYAGPHLERSRAEAMIQYLDGQVERLAREEREAASAAKKASRALKKHHNAVHEEMLMMLQQLDEDEAEDLRTV